MDQGLTLVILLILIVISVVALFIVLRVLFRGLVEEVHRSAVETPSRAFWIGLLNFAFVVALAIAIDALIVNTGLEYLGVVIYTIMVLLIIGLVFGLAGMVELVSDRLVSDQSGWRRTAGGAAALTLACLAPYVGWYGLLPYVSLRGLGAVILSLIARMRSNRSAVRVND
jgi:hypothetical protein